MSSSPLKKIHNSHARSLIIAYLHPLKKLEAIIAPYPFGTHILAEMAKEMVSSEMLEMEILYGLIQDLEMGKEMVKTWEPLVNINAQRHTPNFIGEPLDGLYDVRR
jgi:hypothetical protein